MSLVELLVNQTLDLLLLSVLFNLLGQLRQVVQVVLSLHFHVMRSDDVLLLLLPVEFFSFKVSNLLYFLALLLKPDVSLVVDCLNILHEILAL